MRKTLLTGVLVCMLLACNSHAQEDQVKEGPSYIKNEGIREKFLATSSTTTQNVITTLTTVVPFTCYVSSTNACQGRKLRRMKSISGDFEKLPAKTALDSSTTEELTPEKDGDNLGDVPRFLTVWKTTTSTLTVTSTSFNRDVTVSASAFCTYTGFTAALC
ncbi:uncharacterized protein LOC122248487 isoform X2 [Penaeus japonicus]|uniref:uncharacterized protein LOC122248487 isoform X2 n=1 Tax=Penaeus japonicus TaxID=27405 RepID=UPI001C715B9B|nr:uncharacterized protein LOC122248487 isoform X2 [Penaeus japonicus]